MELQEIKQRIYTIREQKVMLDFDLAELYEVETKHLKRQVRRNKERFPADFMFELTLEEHESLRSQIGTLKRGEHSKYAPMFFTEQGVAMLSGVVNSTKAIAMNIAIMRAFIALRQYAFNYKDLADKIELVLARQDGYDTHLSQIYAAIEELLGDKEEQKALEKAWKNRERIGFKQEG